MFSRIVAYLGLPVSHADPTVSWRLVAEDHDSSAARLVIRDTLEKQTQSYHGKEQVLVAKIPLFSEAPVRVVGVTKAQLLRNLKGEVVTVGDNTAAHLLSNRMAQLHPKAALRRIYAARVRKACPGHMGGPMVEPTGLSPSQNPAISCGTCAHFCATRNICKLFGDYPVTYNLVCVSWTF